MDQGGVARGAPYVRRTPHRITIIPATDDVSRIAETG